MEQLLRLTWLALIWLIPAAFVFLVLCVIYKRLRISKPQSLPLRSPTGEILFTWDDWHREAEEDHPVRYFITETLAGWAFDVWRSVVELKHNFVTRRIRKWHCLDFRGSDYTGGEIPCADAMLYASFALLVRFVEKEGRWIFAYTPADALGENEIKEELKELYRWWKDDRQKDLTALKEIPPLDRPMHRYNLHIHDQYMLSRLINARLKMY